MFSELSTQLTFLTDPYRASSVWMNQLQSISTEDHGHLFVTMNPPFEPDESKVISRHQYDHAVVDVKVRARDSRSCTGGVSHYYLRQGVRAQRRMHEIQAKRGISFAGAWMNYTFHEDGFNAGLHAALNVSGLSHNTNNVPRFQFLTSSVL